LLDGGNFLKHKKRRGGRFKFDAGMAGSSRLFSRHPYFLEMRGRIMI
jgi:hypothetical protein